MASCVSNHTVFNGLDAREIICIKNEHQDPHRECRCSYLQRARLATELAAEMQIRTCSH